MDQDISVIVDALVMQLTTPAIGVWLIQTLKNARWFPAAWLNPKSTKAVQRLYAVAVAILGGMGVSWEVHGDLVGGGTMLIAWPALSAMAGMAYHGLSNFVLQEIVYKVHQISEARHSQPVWKQ